MEEDLVKVPHEKQNGVQKTLAQLTVVGQVGVDGTLVVNPVELGPKNAREAVRDHLPVMAGKLVREKQGKNSCAINSPVQPTEAGLIGELGQPVPNPVNPGHKLAHEAAHSRRLRMAGKLVQDK